MPDENIEWVGGEKERSRVCYWYKCKRLEEELDNCCIQSSAEHDEAKGRKDTCSIAHSVYAT